MLRICKRLLTGRPGRSSSACMFSGAMPTAACRISTSGGLPGGQTLAKSPELSAGDGFLWWMRDTVKEAFAPELSVYPTVRQACPQLWIREAVHGVGAAVWPQAPASDHCSQRLDQAALSIDRVRCGGCNNLTQHRTRMRQEAHRSADHVYVVLQGSIYASRYWGDVLHG